MRRTAGLGNFNLSRAGRVSIHAPRAGRDTKQCKYIKNIALEQYLRVSSQNIKYVLSFFKKNNNIVMKTNEIDLARSISDENGRYGFAEGILNQKRIIF